MSAGDPTDAPLLQEEPAAPSTPAAATNPEVLARWDRDIAVINDSIGLLLCNKVAEADQRLQDGAVEIEAREMDFAAGDRDLRGGFAFVEAVFALIHGLASLQNDQLDIVLKRVWAADERLKQDGDWVGKTILRGFCLLVAGVVELMQMRIPSGTWHILRSWLWLSCLESDALNFQGHERSCVRSTALLALGVFNLLSSLLPPTAMKAATWVTGFSGGMDTAMQQLRDCWAEEGIMAPFAGLILSAAAVDLSTFLGETCVERKVKLAETRRVLDWAAKRYPDSFFFSLIEASYRSSVCDLPGALQTMEAAKSTVENLPAFVFLVNIRVATFHACQLSWSDAAEAYLAAVDVHRQVDRRAFCPTLALNAHLCFIAAGDLKRAAEALSVARSYRSEKKKWSDVDKASLQHAEQANLLMIANGSVQPDAEDKEASTATPTSEIWRPMMLLYLKICVIYRGVHFMSDDVKERFIALVRAETAACQEDALGTALGSMILAEAMRQCERWDDALSLSSEVLRLKPELSAIQQKEYGAVPWAALVAAFAHFAKGNTYEAKESLKFLDSLPADHFFQKAVGFKSTHLHRLVGLEFKDAYLEVMVPARDKKILIADVPEGVETVEWELLLTEYSLSVEVSFQGCAGADDGGGSAGILTQTTEKHQADQGPLLGSFAVPGPGRLVVTLDNSFSMMRAKTMHCRASPPDLLKFRCE